jgi:type III secretion system FlhB-like substrate exporter
MSSGTNRLLFILYRLQINISYCDRCRILPESIPWLVANGRHKEAEDIIRAAAKFNKVLSADSNIGKVMIKALIVCI